MPPSLVVTCREGARVLHQLCLYNGDSAGQQPSVTPAGPVLPANRFLWRLSLAASQCKTSDSCICVPFLQFLWHDRVLRQDQHVPVAQGLLQS